MREQQKSTTVTAYTEQALHDPCNVWHSMQPERAWGLGRVGSGRFRAKKAKRQSGRWDVTLCRGRKGSFPVAARRQSGSHRSLFTLRFPGGRPAAASESPAQTHHRTHARCPLICFLSPRVCLRACGVIVRSRRWPEPRAETELASTAGCPGRLTSGKAVGMEGAHARVRVDREKRRWLWPC